MPEVEKYGAQPPIELLRQFAGAGGWYDFAEMAFKTVEDTVLVAAMGPPGGGRNTVTPRLLRHFDLLTFTDFNDAVMAGIFSTLVTWSFGKSPFAADVVALSGCLTAATLDAYKAAMRGLRPTPAKSHYTFNLRDFSRVIEGVFLAAPPSVPSSAALARLWAHEVLRVFSDRLGTDDDSEWVVGMLRTMRSVFSQRAMLSLRMPAATDKCKALPVNCETGAAASL